MMAPEDVSESEVPFEEMDTVEAMDERRSGSGPSRSSRMEGSLGSGQLFVPPNSYKYELAYCSCSFST